MVIENIMDTSKKDYRRLWEGSLGRKTWMVVCVAFPVVVKEYTPQAC